MSNNGICNLTLSFCPVNSFLSLFFMRIYVQPHMTGLTSHM